MWLQRLLNKQGNYGTGSSPSGGAGSGAGGSTPNFSGQAQIFQDDVPNREERYNTRKRQRKRKMLERQQKWRSSKDRQSTQ